MNDKNLRVAVVGAGPAGLYSIAHLLEDNDHTVEIDLYERLATPWGLVRSGVAPDHSEKKLVADRLFDHYLNNPRVRFLGNVEIGTDVLPAELLDWYDAVIYSVGANDDIRMGIPGENLPGCLAAREFVAWYNGHPDYSNLDLDLSHERAVIIGNGNVAIDIARILTLPVKELQQTDIADHAISALRKSKIKEVVLLARRGHFQGAFNNPEIEELLHLVGVDVIIDDPGQLDDNDGRLASATWEERRKVETLRLLAAKGASGAEKRIVLRFLGSPVELSGNGKVESLSVVKNSLEYSHDGSVRARATDRYVQIKTGLLMRSIGYKGSPIAGLPFDESRGIISNTHGRVDSAGTELHGIYVSGWIKRGPKGVIGSNKKCARDTIDSLLKDFAGGLLTPASKSSAEVLSVLSRRQPKLINFQGWKNIDRHERLKGAEDERPRVKICDTRELLKAADQ
ncbi:NADPH-ferredoxin reductase FprA [Zhongshania aliphaticivorans]|uniref:NADPH-ferredoxin reductase FprA n=1 Tax=Zhongshania aliphaticivorans TaxID=1470434 RepID=A0A5S9Q1U6_9GAMM|nr:FAD-dependent oxidoreductase [Zhongshania aliphaticivorans]CAA0093533.1 NADPH-ferredoxin reductase FprA [Zhongshania aliphaticivorans]CAA0111482.1 NADPH-ferredoxin reductase FprA [Zhongshania aliphaticivorans]